MACQTLAIGDQVAHICRGPATREVVNRRDGQARWCFVCRKHREFRYIVMTPIEPDWYGPHADVKCETCKTSDSDLFPGRVREWE